MRALIIFSLPSLAVSVIGATSEMRFAFYAAAAVLIVLIVSLLILALRNIGPIFERGETKFRLGPIREKKKSPPRKRR